MGVSLTAASFWLSARAVGTLLAGGAAATRACREWLPPPAELLAIAKAELSWDVWLSGAQHPALA